MGRPTIREAIAFLSLNTDLDRPLADVVGIQTVQEGYLNRLTYKSTQGPDDIRAENGHLIFEVRID